MVEETFRGLWLSNSHPLYVRVTVSGAQSESRSLLSHLPVLGGWIYETSISEMNPNILTRSLPEIPEVREI